MSNEKRKITDPGFIQKSVTIQIAEEDWITLRENNYALCFAKKVSGTYNVVWQSYSTFLMSNQFGWLPEYQIFGSNTYEENQTVQESAEPVSVGLGETILLDGNGHLGPGIEGGPDTEISMDNEYGPIHPGLSQLAISINGTQVISPIYVQPQVSVKGTVSMTPQDLVLVWFEQNIQTSTIFGAARSMSVEIDLTNTNSAARLYQNQQWSTP